MLVFDTLGFWISIPSVSHDFPIPAIFPRHLQALVNLPFWKPRQMLPPQKWRTLEHNCSFWSRVEFNGICGKIAEKEKREKGKVRVIGRVAIQNVVCYVWFCYTHNGHSDFILCVNFTPYPPSPLCLNPSLNDHAKWTSLTFERFCFSHGDLIPRVKTLSAYLRVERVLFTAFVIPPPIVN